MIVVVEGPSAVGKTTWLRRWSRQEVVDEDGRVDVPVELVDDDASFWADRNAARWARAIATEATYGRALCDGDPLKLSYHYCLARIERLPWSRFDAGVAACRSAIGAGRLGIADAIFCSVADLRTLDAHRADDHTRRRRNFAVNRLLGPPLRDWYDALDRLDPGRVEWSFPDRLPSEVSRSRCDIELYETWMATLPGRNPTSR